MTNYFSDLIASLSWSAVKLDLYGFKFYTPHVLRKPWAMPNFIKPPKVQGLPDIVTVDDAQRLFSATRTLSYRVFYFTRYSMGLRLSEGLALKVGDQCHPQNASMSNQRAAFLRAGAGLPAQAVVGLLAPGAAP